MFWESTYSSFAQDEYLNSLQDAQEARFLTKQENLYNLENRNKESKTGLINKSFLSNVNLKQTAYPLPLFSEESEVNPSLIPLKDFEPFATEVLTDSFEDTYESIKYANYAHLFESRSFLLSSPLMVSPISYNQVLDTFTAAYEEQQTHVDVSNFQSDCIEDIEGVDFQSGNTYRSTNPLTLRSSAKNSLVTYNALQKVFKSRFDEGRSNARLQDFSNSSVKHPFITAKKTPYGSLLGKNKASFYVPNNYVNSLSTNFSELFSV
jgi:hypothetical protein